MTVISWDSGELDAAGRSTQRDGVAIAQQQHAVTDPDPALDGQFLANAVALTEPRASGYHRELLAALGTAVTGLGDRLSEAAARYAETGTAAEQDVDRLFSLIQGGH